MEQAKNDWIFVIDSDEEISSELKNELLNIKYEGTKFDVYAIRRKVYSHEQMDNTYKDIEDQLERINKNPTIAVMESYYVMLRYFKHAEKKISDKADSDR